MLNTNFVYPEIISDDLNIMNTAAFPYINYMLWRTDDVTFDEAGNGSPFLLNTKYTVSLTCSHDPGMQK